MSVPCLSLSSGHCTRLYSLLCWRALHLLIAAAPTSDGMESVPLSPDWQCEAGRERNTK